VDHEQRDNLVGSTDLHPLHPLPLDPKRSPIAAYVAALVLTGAMLEKVPLIDNSPKMPGFRLWRSYRINTMEWLYIR
jgi:hypothetical protein